MAFMENSGTENFGELGTVEIEVYGGEDDFELLAGVVDEIVSEIDEDSDEDDCEIISFEKPREKKIDIKNNGSTPKQTNIISFFLTNGHGKKPPITFIPDSPQFNHKRKRQDKTKANPIKKLKLENRQSTMVRKKKICPDYKKIPGTSFTVDAFSYGIIPDCTAYFLSHFHSDHYMGLRKSFSSSLFCTQTTANLMKAKIGVSSTHIHPLSLNTPHVVEGVEVLFLDANHCPGSVIILFSTPDGKHHLHTGDFRGHPKMECYEALLGLDVLDTLYLDTTYINPIYTFPPQEEVVSHAATLCKNALKSDSNTLILVGSYLVGKERMYLGIADSLDCKICVSKSKLTLLNCYEWPELKSRLTTDSQASKLHVVKISSLTIQAIKQFMERLPSYTSVLAIRPTGWAFKKNQLLTQIKPIRYYNITIYDLPYSEHSSYNELRRFVKFVRPKKVVPTVNIQDSKNMETLFKFWLNESTE